MNNKLSKRLLSLASMIEDCKNVYDVGCDHAYLDIYLTLERSNIYCYAIDIRPSVIKIAKENIKKYGLDIPVLLNDGLDNLSLKRNSVVVIAGMGTRNILKIIKNKKLEEVIIQSNDDLVLLRSQLSKLGYKIIDEKVVYEEGYFYVFIKAVLGTSCYTKEELLLGPILSKNNSEIFQDYLQYLIKKYNKMLATIPKEFLGNANKIKENKKIIETYLEKQIKMT